MKNTQHNFARPLESNIETHAELLRLQSMQTNETAPYLLFLLHIKDYSAQV